MPAAAPMHRCPNTPRASVHERAGRQADTPERPSWQGGHSSECLSWRACTSDRRRHRKGRMFLRDCGDGARAVPAMNRPRLAHVALEICVCGRVRGGGDGWCADTSMHMHAWIQAYTCAYARMCQETKAFTHTHSQTIALTHTRTYIPTSKSISIHPCFYLSIYL